MTILAAAIFVICVALPNSTRKYRPVLMLVAALLIFISAIRVYLGY